MKRIFFVLVLLAGGFELIAQQQYFVFIQESKGQPFYVRIKEDSHSSSASGHIILPQLKDSVYSFFIGFPKDRYGEQLFMIAMNRKDHGYELRNMGGGRYKLYDLLTLQLIDPMSTETLSDQTIRKTDTYSELMADVVKDSAVLYTSAQDTMSVDSNAVVKKDSVVQTARPVVTQQPPAKDSVVHVKKGKGKGKKGAAAKEPAMVKADPEGSKSDTLSENRLADVPANESPDVKTSAEAEKIDSSAVKKSGETAKKELPAGKTSPEAEKIDSTVVKTTTDSVKNTEQSVQNPPSQNNNPARDRRDIIRLRTENVVEGRLMIFVDRTGAVNDTIRLVIPRRL